MDQFSRKYLSSDNDPLFGYWPWRVHLAEHYQIREIKTVRSYRVHSGLSGKTPAEITGQRHLSPIDMKNFRWKSVCGGMYQTPIPA